MLIFPFRDSAMNLIERGWSSYGKPLQGVCLRPGESAKDRAEEEKNPNIRKQKAIKSLEQVRSIMQGHTYCGYPWETVVCYPESSEVELDGQKIKHDFYTDFEEVVDFYDGDKTEAWMRGIRDTTLLVEARLFADHCQKTNHGWTFVRCRKGDKECKDCKSWRRRRPDRSRIHDRLGLPDVHKHGLRFLINEEDPENPGKFKSYPMLAKELEEGVLAKNLPDHELGDDIIRCKYTSCSTIFKSPTEGRKHYLIIHGISGADCPIPFPCSVCGENFKSRYLLDKHRREAGHRKKDMDADLETEAGADVLPENGRGRGRRGRRGQRVRARGGRGGRGRGRGGGGEEGRAGGDGLQAARGRGRGHRGRGEGGGGIDEEAQGQVTGPGKGKSKGRGKGKGKEPVQVNLMSCSWLSVNICEGKWQILIFLNYSINLLRFGRL